MAGSASAFYIEEIAALQTYQKEILKALDDLTSASTALTTNEALTAVDAVSGALGGVGANNGLGAFDEAATLSTTYNNVMQTLMTNFKEISELVTAMANALGKSAQSYQETEQQITDSFNQIVSKYEAQSGGFNPTPTTTAPGTPTGQSGTTGTYNSATPATASNTTTTTTSTTPNTTTTTTPTSTTSSSTPSTPSGTGSISQDNTANSSNDTSSEE
jgi:prefoldin subunit 5